MISNAGAEQSFLDAIRASGINPPLEIIADGKLHRFNSDATGNKKNGFYTFFPDEPPSGVFGCHKRDIKEKWCSRSGGESNLTEAEREELKMRMEKARQQREQERIREQAGAAKTAAFIWGQSSEAPPDYPYLKHKGILSHGTRVTRKSEKYPEQALVVPVWSISKNSKKGEITSLQFIRQDGSKNFLGGGAIAGGFFHIGRYHPNTLVICEGFATGASIHQATGYLVIVAFIGNNLMAVAHSMRERYPDAYIIFAADDDWKVPGNPGLSHAIEAAKAIDGVVRIPDFTGMDRLEKHTDFNDLHKLGGMESVIACINSEPNSFPVAKVNDPDAKTETPSDGWIELLVRTQSKDGEGAYCKNIANALVVLEHHPEWKGVLAFDDFGKCIVATRRPPSHDGAYAPKKYPHTWTDTDDILATAWMQRLTPSIGSDTKITSSAIDAVSRKTRIHPVRDYLNSLRWDGKGRLDSWLKVFFGCMPYDDDGEYSPDLDRYLRTVGSKWLISAVARIMEPGCQADCCLVIEGEQGLKKSTSLKALFGSEWFTDQLDGIGSKDTDMQLEGVWCVEFSELDALSRHEASSVKAFISRAFERYVKKWAKRAERNDRQCIFAGTVNGSGYFKDETGNRRFWPVLCLKTDIEGLKANRDQLWAEALHRFKAKEPFHLSAEDDLIAKVEQAKRMYEDPWQGPIESFLSQHQRVVMPMVLKSALFLPIDKWSQKEQNRASAVMKRLGWVRKKVRLKHGEASIYGMTEKEDGLAWVYEKQNKG